VTGEWDIFVRDAAPVAGTTLPCLYLFLDEGGNLDFSPSGTKYFTVSSVARVRPFGWHTRLVDLKYGLIEGGMNIESFHASEDRQAVRDRVFGIVSEDLRSVRIDSLVVEKRKTGPALQPVERFYPRMLGYLLRFVINNVRADAFSEVILLTDALPVERKRNAVEKAIKETLAGMLPATMRYRVFHHASKSNFELQVADYCNWAIYRKWEKGDLRSYDIIKPAVRSEYEIFKSGQRFYY
jgi:hypothetical protein